MVTPGPQFDDRSLIRLLKAKEEKKLAQEAKLMAEEQAKQITPPSTDVVERAAQATQPGTEPTPLDNPNFFSRLGSNALKAISAPGEVGAGLAFDLFSKDFSKRRRELQNQTPEKGLFDYFSQVRNTYKEKDLPLKYALPLEIALDPLTYIPVAGAANIARRAIQGGNVAAKVTKEIAEQLPKISSTIDFEKAVKVADDAVMKSGSGKFTSENYKGGVISQTFELAKGRGFRLNSANELDRGLMKHMNIGTKINSMASANTAKINSIRRWNNEFIDGKTGLLVNTGTEFDGRQMYEALEDVFDVEKFTGRSDVVDFDAIAKTISKDENQTWLNLIASKEGLETIKKQLVNKKIYNNGYIGRIKDDEIRSLGQYLKGFQELGEQANKAGVNLKLITGQTYLSRRVLSRNVDTVINSRTSGRFGKPTGAEKKRKIRREDFKTENAYRDTLQEIAKAGDIKYLTSLTDIYTAYSRDMYKAMNDNTLRKHLDGLASKPKSGVAFDLSQNAGELQKIVNAAIKNGNKITAGQKKKLKGLGYTNLAEAADTDGFAGLLKRKKQLEEFDIRNGAAARVFESRHGKVPDNLYNFFFTGENGEKLAKRYRDLTGLADDTIFTGLAKSVDAVGGSIRVLKTGFVFGFSLLQGLPMLARASLGDTAAFKTWAKSVENGSRALFGRNAVDQFMQEMRDITVKTVDGDDISLLDEFVLNGGELGEYATDLYRGKSSVARGFQKLGADKLGEVFSGALTPFERSFQFSSDTLRLKGYQHMRNLYFRNAPDGEKGEALKGLISFLNKSTGALNPVAAGIPANQQAIERAFVFFSPRYTRASFSLLADVMRGGVQGREARATMVGLAGFGISHYVAIASALGQEIHLDPRNSKFLTIDIKGNRVGIGSFWTSFARAVVKSADYFDPFDGPKTIREEQQGNPIFQYIRSRTSPGTSLIYNIATGADYLGREFKTLGDWGEFGISTVLPLSLETTLMEGGDLYSRGTRLGAGFFGFRERPVSIWEQRTIMRDDLSMQKYGKKYQDINRLQQNQLLIENDQLKNLDEEAKAEAAKRGDGFDSEITNYYTERDTIQQKYQKQLEDGEEQGYQAGFRPSDYRERVLKPANREKSTLYGSLQDKLVVGGEYERVQTYFDQMGNMFSDKMQVEDNAYQDYIETVILGDFDDIRGYNWIKRDEEERKFIEKWGSEYYDYVKERLKQSKNVSGLAAEFYEMREEYSYFWKETEQAVINSRPDPELAAKLRAQWLRGTDAEREKLSDIQEMEDINSLISGSKRELRKLDSGLDAFLFRWGYYGKLTHKDNKDLEDFYNSYDVLEKELYYNGGPVDFTQV